MGGGGWGMETTVRSDDEVPSLPPPQPRQLRSYPSFDPFISEPGTVEEQSTNDTKAGLRCASASNEPYPSLAFSAQDSRGLSDDGIRNLSLSTWFDKSGERGAAFVPNRERVIDGLLGLIFA